MDIVESRHHEGHSAALLHTIDLPHPLKHIQHLQITHSEPRGEASHEAQQIDGKK